MNPWLRCLLIVVGVVALSSFASAQSLTCGIQPIPNVGCRIGRCVDGAWEQVCDRGTPAREWHAAK